nr:reverse transcriptase domain-containing protein [Tanacetum cinerariifolium]
MSGNGDHHRQGRRFAAEGNGHDPRDVEIEDFVNGFVNLKSIRSIDMKDKILEFEGRLCPDDFLDWLRTLDCIFDLRETPDHIKVKLVAIRLKNLLLYGGIMCKINGTERVNIGLNHGTR